MKKLLSMLAVIFMSLQAPTSVYATYWSTMTGNFCIKNNTNGLAVLKFADPVGNAEISDFFSGTNKTYLPAGDQYCASHNFGYGDGISVFVGGPGPAGGSIFTFFSGAYGPQVATQKTQYQAICYSEHVSLPSLVSWNFELTIKNCNKK